MIELAIGTRFYYKGKLCEVVEAQADRCRECNVDFDVCIRLECEHDLRKDGKYVCFKFVQE